MEDEDEEDEDNVVIKDKETEEKVMWKCELRPYKQRASFHTLDNLEKQRLYTKGLSSISIPDHVETRKASDSSKKTHFSSFYPGSKFFIDRPRLMTV
ncbi:unnamed protein product, partial [Soboliphyme baturini]|uniref:Uncharacterized protein n=1 Tax=Soboliphyme baturini TaxID=241478 RepID=A0A183J5G5_9BILA